MFWIAVFLGVIEGLTEFLPISSTAHLVLAEHVLDLKSDFFKSFAIVIQLGAILAVLTLYWRSFLVERAILMRVVVACVPTVICGLLLYKLVKQVFMESPEIILWSLAIGGVALIAFELFHGERENGVDSLNEITWRQAFWVGLCQVIAMIPGVSRAAATAVGGMMVGVKRKTVVEFSFLLAVPTMFGAACLDIYKSGSSFSTTEIQLLAVGFVTSFLVALAAIKLLLRFIQTHSFIAFGVYRIVAAGLFWMIAM